MMASEGTAPTVPFGEICMLHCSRLDYCDEIPRPIVGQKTFQTTALPYGEPPRVPRPTALSVGCGVTTHHGRRGPAPIVGWSGLDRRCKVAAVMTNPRSRAQNMRRIRRE